MLTSTSVTSDVGGVLVEPSYRSTDVMSGANDKISVYIVNFRTSKGQVTKHNTVLEAKDIHTEGVV